MVIRMFYTAKVAAKSNGVLCILLGRGFAWGMYGLPKDPAKARTWLEKVVNEDDLKLRIDKAKFMLTELGAEDA